MLKFDAQRWELVSPLFSLSYSPLRKTFVSCSCNYGSCISSLWCLNLYSGHPCWACPLLSKRIRLMLCWVHRSEVVERWQSWLFHLFVDTQFSDWTGVGSIISIFMPIEILIQVVDPLTDVGCSYVTVCFKSDYHWVESHTFSQVTVSCWNLVFTLQCSVNELRLNRLYNLRYVAQGLASWFRSCPSRWERVARCIPRTTFFLYWFSFLGSWCCCFLFCFNILLEFTECFQCFFWFYRLFWSWVPICSCFWVSICIFINFVLF